MIKKIVCASLSLLAAMHAYATEDVFGSEVPLIWQKIIILSGGPAWTGPSAGQDQYIYPIINPPFITQYIPEFQTQTVGIGEVVFALQRFIEPCLLGQLGVGLGGTTNVELLGTTTVDSVPDIYSYRYKVNHGRLELKGKLIRTDWDIQPYVSGSLGAGFNNSHEYIPVSALPLTLPAPWFAAHTTVGFTYSLGLGLQTMVSRHWQVGLGYEFSDWGKSFLAGDDMSVNGGISLTHLYTNELLFSVGYVFW